MERDTHLDSFVVEGILDGFLFFFFVFVILVILCYRLPRLSSKIIARLPLLSLNQNGTNKSDDEKVYTKVFSSIPGNRCSLKDFWLK